MRKSSKEMSSKEMCNAFQMQACDFLVDEHRLKLLCSTLAQRLFSPPSHPLEAAAADSIEQVILFQIPQIVTAPQLLYGTKYLRNTY